MSPIALFGVLILLSACHARLGLIPGSSPAASPGPSSAATGSSPRTTEVPASGLDPGSTTEEATSGPAATGDGPGDEPGDGLPIKMANVYGMRRAAAEAALREARVRGPIVTEVTEQWIGPVDFARASVCAQSPEPGEPTTTDRRVVLSYCDPDRLPRPGSRQNPTVLTGYTVEEAKRRARRAGYAFRIEVVPMADFDPACKPATVCRLNVWRWEANVDTTLKLYVNRSITISTPN